MVVDAYHQFEKHWYEFLSSIGDKSKIRSYSDLKKVIKNYKDLDESKLDYVNLLSNILKHGDKKKIINLHQLRPDVFNEDEYLRNHGVGSITIKNKDVFDIYGIISKAGPSRLEAQDKGIVFK